MGESKRCLELDALRPFDVMRYTYKDNKSGSRKSAWIASAAAVVGPLEDLRGAVEMGAYANSELSSYKTPAFVNASVICRPTDKLDFDLGYKCGLNDVECRHSFGAGLQSVVETQRDPDTKPGAYRVPLVRGVACTFLMGI
ncbi:MAG: hypothetical protein KJ634_13240 [Gammaproteobacteria bacterium]|nr:hypothetical protein [Gammaproteobacteria bacterium]MBU1416582.1 hypothetical protein [Gammaproteobacteria bacterium]